MKTGFVPITLEEYVELHLKSNPDTSREEITIALRGALEEIIKRGKMHKLWKSPLGNRIGFRQ